jgi:hypothetical protein
MKEENLMTKNEIEYRSYGVSFSARKRYGSAKIRLN